MKLVSGGNSFVNSSIQVSSSAIGSGVNIVFSKTKELQLYLRETTKTSSSSKINY